MAEEISQATWSQVFADLHADKEAEARMQREIERQKQLQAATPQERARVTAEFLAKQEKDARGARSRRYLADLNAKNARDMTDAEWQTTKRRMGLR